MGLVFFIEKNQVFSNPVLKGLAVKGKVYAFIENMPEDICLDILSDPKKTSPELNSCFTNIIELPILQFKKIMLKAVRYNK